MQGRPDCGCLFSDYLYVCIGIHESCIVCLHRPKSLLVRPYSFFEWDCVVILVHLTKNMWFLQCFWIRIQKKLPLTGTHAHAHTLYRWWFSFTRPFVYFIIGLINVNEKCWTILYMWARVIFAFSLARTLCHWPQNKASVNWTKRVPQIQNWL